MKHLIRMAAVGATLLAGVTAAWAQSKTIQGPAKTLTATVEAIEPSTRSLTLKGAEGNYVTLIVPNDVTRFDNIKVGDTLTARYYESLVLRLKPEGEKEADDSGAAVTRAGNAKPGATAATQRTITATITAIDPKVPSITFTGPNNWKYSSRVEDKKALAKVKVGDRVDITWTEALLVSFSEAKK
jgi:hypothetical protein